MGILDMIILSKKETPPKIWVVKWLPQLLDTSVPFTVPFGMISPTLYDVVTIMGLPIDGDEIPFLHELIGNDLGF